jgi:hypothetical protein
MTGWVNRRLGVGGADSWAEGWIGWWSSKFGSLAFRRVLVSWG